MALLEFVDNVISSSASHVQDGTQKADFSKHILTTSQFLLEKDIIN